MKTFFAIIGAVVFVLWLAGAVGLGQFILYYGKPGMSVQPKDQS